MTRRLFSSSYISLCKIFDPLGGAILANLEEDHVGIIPVQFHQNPIAGLLEEVDFVNLLTTLNDGRRTPDDGPSNKLLWPLASRAKNEINIPISSLILIKKKISLVIIIMCI